VIDEPHVQDEVVALVEQILVGGDVVADDVVSLPSAAERESGSDFELDCVIESSEGRGGNVADVITVVSVGG